MGVGGNSLRAAGRLTVLGRISTIVVLVFVLITTACSPRASGAFNVLSPTNGSSVPGTSVLVEGIASPGATVTHDIALAADDHATADPSGHWSMTVELDEGLNTLKFRLGDDESTAVTITVTSAAAAAPTEAAASEPGVEATPAPAKAVFTYKASGTHKSKAFAITLPARVDYTYAGSGNFIASVESASGSGSFGQIANIIKSFKATTWLYGDGLSGRVFLDVIADGKYTIKVTSGDSPGTKNLPVTYKGTWGLATQPFAASGDVTVTYSHKGTGNFIVSVIDASTGDNVDLIANEIGRVASDTNLFGLDGIYALDVTADGAWSIALTLQ
jgi:hypothetical protein